MMTETLTKQVRLAFARTSNDPEKHIVVDVLPEDSASAVLEKAGLDPNGYYLMKPGDDGSFDLTEMVFPAVSDGTKLHIVARSTVGM